MTNMKGVDKKGENNPLGLKGVGSTRPKVNPYVSKGAYHGILQDMAQSISKNVSDYFTEGDWIHCGQNLRNMNNSECQKFNREYNRFWNDIISKDPSFEIYRKFERALVDMGIDAADIIVYVGVSIAFTPSGKFAIAGPKASVVTLLKELNQGKLINDPEVWEKVAKSAVVATSASVIKTGIKTESTVFDTMGKVGIDMLSATIKSGNRQSIVEAGGKSLVTNISVSIINKT
jgi:hypothetical protein